MPEFISTFDMNLFFENFVKKGRTSSKYSDKQVGQKEELSQDLTSVKEEARKRFSSLKYTFANSNSTPAPIISFLFYFSNN